MLALSALALLGISLTAVSVKEHKQKVIVKNDVADAVQQKRLNDATAAKAAAQSGQVVLKLVERRMADLAATKATTSTTAPPTTVTPTTTPVAATPPSNPPPPPNPCPKSREEAEFVLGGEARYWEIVPESDGQGWHYGGKDGGPKATLTHPGYGRLDVPQGQVSSGTIRATIATLWCQATGGDPADSLTAPAPASGPTPTRAAASQPSPAAPAPTQPAPAQPVAPVAPPAPSCPTFGGAATNPIGDGGCKYSGSEVTAPVPSGWSARFRDASTVACSGVSITTSITSMYPASELGCNFSGEPQAPPAPAPGPAPAPTPPSGGSGCPSFAGINTNPLNDGTGGCKLALQSTNVSGKVPSGWKMVYWTGTATAEAGSGSTVDLQEGTLYPA